MPLQSFRQIFLPYCIRIHPDGTFSILNREYQDLGLQTEGKEPTRYSLKGIGPKGLDDAIGESQNGQDWFLYKDGSRPDLGAEHWDAYQRKLRVLTRLIKSE